MPHRVWLRFGVFAFVTLLVVSTAFLGGAGTSSAAPGLAPLADETPQESPPAQYADSFDVTGLVAQPRSFTRDDLVAMRQVTMQVAYGSGPSIESALFEGPSLRDVIEASGGLAVDPAVRNDKLGVYVLVSGADGYRAVIAWGEIDPDFGGQQMFLAIKREGEFLGDGEGMARIVVPADKRGGRHVNRVTAIDVRRAE